VGHSVSLAGRWFGCGDVRGRWMLGVQQLCCTYRAKGHLARRRTGRKCRCSGLWEARVSSTSSSASPNPRAVRRSRSRGQGHAGRQRHTQSKKTRAERAGQRTPAVVSPGAPRNRPTPTANRTTAARPTTPTATWEPCSPVKMYITIEEPDETTGQQETEAAGHGSCTPRDTSRRQLHTGTRRRETTVHAGRGRQWCRCAAAQRHGAADSHSGAA